MIMHSITSVETNVIWNGNQSEFFKPQREIIQGDPISPYVFVLCMDKLSHLIEKEEANKRWKGIKLGKQRVTIYHLMFADDLLILGEATDNQIWCVMETLETFGTMSGQKISHEKTSICFPRVLIKERV